MIIEHLHRDVEAFDVPGLGYVENIITPILPGRIHYAGTSWPAQLSCSEGTEALQPGASVVILGRLGNMMLVVPPEVYNYCPRMQKPCARECLLRINALSGAEI